MKQILFFIIIILLPGIVNAGTTYTSQVSNGDWHTAGTWSPNGIPTVVDNVILKTSVLIKSSDPTALCNNLTIRSGNTLYSNAPLYVYGCLTDSGVVSGANEIVLEGSGITVLRGNGVFNIGTNKLYFNNATTLNDTIASNVSITGNPTIDIYTNTYKKSFALVNLGHCLVSQIINDSPSPIPAKWINGPNSSLTVISALLPNSYDILDASAAGNTAIYSGIMSYSIKQPLSSYYNLTCSTSSGHILTLTSNVSVSGTLLISSGSLDVSTSNYALSIGGNFTNNASNAAFSARNGTVTLTGSAGQTIGGTAASTFYNLIATGTGSETVTLGAAQTISNNLTISAGTLDCQTFQITGNATGMFSMAANTFLLLGKTSSITNVFFPTNFASGNISLNASNTVEYLANTSSQTISVVPATYGNVIVDASSVVSKSLSGSPLTIAGNLTINTASPTVSALANTINLTGNLINNGTLSFSSGALNIAGNITNNNVFTGGTSTTTMTGATGQTIGGTASATFYNLTATGTGAETVTLGHAETVSNNLLISGGTFDVSASNYALTIGGGLTANGTLNTESGLITMNGAGQAIGGTSAISFYDLAINETSSAQSVTLNTSENFQDALTMTTGVLAASGSNTMTLLSNATKTARIAQVVTPANVNITAPFVVQRYEGTRTSANYAALSSPVQSAETIMDWNSNNQTSPNLFYMSGVGGPNGKSGSYVSVFLFSETSPNANYGSYVPITTYATPGNTYMVTPGQGIYLWLGTSLSSMSDPFTYLTHGTPSIAPTAGISVTVTNSGSTDGNGFNLIGNPFCSPIDWATFLSSNPSLSATGYYLMGSSGSWTGPFSSGSIPMGQGFGVICSAGSATVVFKENHKTSVDAALKRPLRSAADEPNAVSLVLSDDLNSFTTSTTITLGTDYQKAFNNSYDAPFISSLTPGLPELYTSSNDNYKLCLYRLPDNDKTLTIPLTATGNAITKHTLTIQGLENITSYQCINLIDAETGAVLNNFNTNPAYNFYVSQENEVHHFALQLTKLTANEDCNSTPSNELTGSNIVITPAAYGANVGFNLPEPGNVVISIFNVLGQKVGADINSAAYNNQIPVNLAEGQLYIIKVQTPNGIVTKKLYH